MKNSILRHVPAKENKFLCYETPDLIPFSKKKKIIFSSDFVYKAPATE